MKRIAFVFLLIAFLFLAQSVFASDVELTISSENIVGYTDETVTIDATISNYQDKSDRFSIIIWPPYWETVIVTPEKSIVRVDADQEDRVKIYFDVGLNAKEATIPFKIMVKSLTDGNITDSTSVNLRIIKKIPLSISDIKLDKYTIDPGESIKIEVSVRNLGSDSYAASVQTNIKLGGQIIKRFDDSLPEIEGRSTQKVENSFRFDKYASPEIYTIEAVLKDYLGRTIGTADTTLSVNVVQKITHDKTVTYGLLLQTVTVKVKNEGNVPVTNFYVTEETQTFMRPFVQPMGHYTTEVIYDKILYHWFIPSLMPNEERIVKYQISLWNIWLLLLGAVAVVVFAFRYVFGPQIVKKFTYKGPIKRGKEILVVLEVRNRSRHLIRNVVVKDFVPAIASVVGKFATLRPSLKRTEKGTEIIWKFGNLKPKEERVLTYKIKPVVDVVGTLKLPRAHVRYVDRKKLRKAIASKSIIIKSR